MLWVQVPPSQLCPHLPQLFGSLRVLTQWGAPASPASPLQSVKPPAQVQVLLWQIKPLAHWWVQLPQCAGLFSVFTQSGGVPHSWELLGQTQVPPLQMRPPLHATPHAPQLLGSVCRLTHAPVHAVSPVAQLVVHWLCEQTCVFEQAVVHEPQ